MTEPTWVSILPPLLAILLAIVTRQVYLSLAAGIWLGWAIIEGWNPLAGATRAIEETVNVLGDPGNAKVILFTLVIGSLIATVEAANGVRGFVRQLEDRNWVDSPLRARLVPLFTGMVIFIESNITVLVSGAIGRPLFDRFRISREKLAYLIDSTSAPICILIPLNAWGAYILGILDQLAVPDPLAVFLSSIPFNFYALLAVILATAVAIFGIDIGPMRRAEARTRDGKLLWDDAVPLVDPDVIAPAGNENIPARARNMVLPIAAMVLMMPIALLITGNGDLRAGVGSTSVLWSVMMGLLVAWLLLLSQRFFSVDQLTRTALKGAGGLISLALILLLALALSAVANALGTGVYIAGLAADFLPPPIFLPLVFLTSSVIAFSTGTSWGTFAIMLPIAVPAAVTLGLPLAPFVAASLAGGIFGDHSSPISDTTIISSMAAATDHIDHVRTQLPYALLAGAAATILYAVVGATF